MNKKNKRSLNRFQATKKNGTSSKTYGQKALDIEAALKAQRESSYSKSSSLNDTSESIVSSVEIKTIPGHYYNAVTDRYYKTEKRVVSAQKSSPCQYNSERIVEIVSIKSPISLLRSLYKREINRKEPFTKLAMNSLLWSRLKFSSDDILPMNNLEYDTLSCNKSFISVGKSNFDRSTGLFTKTRNGNSTTSNWLRPCSFSSGLSKSILIDQSLAPANRDILCSLWLDSNNLHAKLSINSLVNTEIAPSLSNFPPVTTVMGIPIPDAFGIRWDNYGESVFICSESGLYRVNLNPWYISMMCSMKKSTKLSSNAPVKYTKQHIVKGLNINVIGMRNGNLYGFDERENALLNESTLFGKMKYRVNHIAIVQEYKIVARDITGEIMLFDVRRPSAQYSKIKSGDENRIDTGNFWVSGDDKFLLASVNNLHCGTSLIPYEGHYMETDRSSCSVGVWDISNRLVNDESGISRPLLIKSTSIEEPITLPRGVNRNEIRFAGDSDLHRFQSLNDIIALFTCDFGIRLIQSKDI